MFLCVIWVMNHAVYSRLFAFVSRFEYFTGHAVAPSEEGEECTIGRDEKIVRIGLFGFRNRNAMPQLIKQDACTITSFRSNGYMYRNLVDALRRILRVEERRLTPEELRQLAEAILDYGRMIAHEELSALPPPYVIVEIHESARRFRETPQTIKDALLLLNDMGRAEPADRGGHWKLKLADTFRPRGRATRA